MADNNTTTSTSSIPHHDIVRAGDVIRAKHMNFVINGVNSLLQSNSKPTQPSNTTTYTSGSTNGIFVWGLNSRVNTKIDRFSPCVITGMILDSVTSDAFGVTEVLKGQNAYKVEPLSEENKNMTMVIAQDDIAYGVVRSCMTSGVSPIWLTGPRIDGSYKCKIDVDISTTAMIPDSNGSYDIMYDSSILDDGEGERLGTINLGGGGGGINIATYTTFPAIPTAPTLISLGADLWFATTGSTVWRPLTGYSTRTGVPGTT